MNAGTYHHRDFGEYTVVSDLGWDKVTVMFKDTGYTYTTRRSHVRNNVVFDKISPAVCGVGFIGEGCYTSRSHKKAYDCWVSMIKRCYLPNDNMFSSYGGVGVSVCEQWFDFQSFAGFYEKNHPKRRGYQIDKDVLLQGNKVYCPSLCVFIPEKLNAQFKSKIGGGELPHGVCNSIKGSYTTHIQVDGKCKYLGSFSTPEEAGRVYADAKMVYIKELATSMYTEGAITEDVLIAAINYKI